MATAAVATEHLESVVATNGGPLAPPVNGAAEASTDAPAKAETRHGTGDPLDPNSPS